MSTTIGRLLIELAANTAQFESDFSRAAKRAAAEAARLQREFERLGKGSFSNTLAANTGLAALGREASVTTGKLISLNSVVTTVAGSFAAWQIYEFAKDVVNVTSKFIGFEQALIATTGSQQAAREELAFVAAEAERLGLELSSTTKQYVSLVAAARGSSMEGEGVRETFTAISEAARVLNMSVDQTEGALRAVQQMLSKGNVQAEELRGQLGERLYGAFVLAAEAMGVTQAELNDLLKQGKVAAEDLLPKFTVELRKLYAAQAEVAATTPVAEFNRLKNAFTELKLEFGKGDFMTALVESVRDLTKYMRELNESGAVKSFSDSVGSLIRMLDELAIALAVFIGVRALGGVAGALGNMSKAVGVATKGATAFMGAVKALDAILIASIATLGRWNLLAAAAGAAYLGIAQIQDKWTPTFAKDAIAQAIPVINDFRTAINNANADIRSANYEEIKTKYAAFRGEVERLTQAYNALKNQEGIGSTTAEAQRRLGELEFLRNKIIETEKAAAPLLELLNAISAGPPAPEGGKPPIPIDVDEFKDAVEEIDQLILRYSSDLEKLDAEYAKNLKMIEEFSKKYGKLPGVMEKVAKATDYVQLAYSEKRKELAALTPMQEEFNRLLSDTNPSVRLALGLKENLVLLDKIEKEWKQQGIDISALIDVRKKLIQSYQLEAEAARRRADPVGVLIEDMKEELATMKLGNIERQKAILLRRTEAAATEQQKREIQQLLVELEREAARGNYGSYVDAQGFGVRLDTFEDWIGGAFDAALTDAADSFIDVLKRGLKESARDFKSMMKLAADGLSFVADAVDQFRQNPDAPLRAITNIAAELPGVVGDVARAVQAIDSIFGGRLLGTNYELDRTGRNISLGQGGFSGSTFTTEVRQRSFFRGRAWRTDTDPLEQQVVDSLRQIFDSIREAMRDSAQALSTAVPDLITGSFREVLDKNGKVIEQLSTVLGQTYKESFEQFVKRLTAENIIAVIESALAGSGEANAIAERFRQNADDLLGAAKAMLQAQEAIQRNQGLLGTGASLSDTIALVEDLALAGERMDAAWTRVYGSTMLLEQALGLANVSLDITREEFVRFATDITAAAGGLDRATSLWNAYFNTFYTAEERVAFQLAQATRNRDEQLADIGLSPDISNADFRALFEELLPTLSAEAIVEWLEAAEAIGVVIDLEEQLTEAREQAAGKYEEFMQGIRDALFEEDASDFAISMRDISRELRSNIDEANALARAAGMQGAAESDLAAIHELAARKAAAAIRALRKSTQSLINELYGSRADQLNTQISELESRYSQEGDMINQVADEARNRYERELEALKKINDYLNDVLFSQVSPLTPRERLDEAQRIYDDLVARAASGDTEALEELQGAAQRYLEEARTYFGSSQDYVDIFAAVTSRLRQFVDAGPMTENPGGPGGSGGPYSEELNRLYRERDELLAQQTAENRLLLAMDLAEHLRQLSEAIGTPIAELAEELGLDLNDLLADLGINLDNLTTETLTRLGDVANMLGLELSELAEAVGIELGELGDINSLMSQAFLEEIAEMPAGIRDRLREAFDSLTSAVISGGDTADALTFLQDIVNELPVEFRDQLAPFFGEVDPAEDPVVDWLEQIQGSSQAIFDMGAQQRDATRSVRNAVDESNARLDRIANLLKPTPQVPKDVIVPTNPPPDPFYNGDETQDPLLTAASFGVRGGAAAEVVQELKALRSDLKATASEQARAITRQTEELKRR